MSSPVSARRLVAPGPLLVALLMLVLLGACSSSDDTEAADGSTTAPAAGDEGDRTADPAVADAQIAEQWASSLTGLPTAEDEVSCMLERADGDATLTSLFATPAAPSEDQFSALAGAVHSCVDNETLAGSLLNISGAESDADRDAFTMCVEERISDPENGDLVYAGLSALNRSVDVPVGAQDVTIEAGQACQSTDGLVNLFALSTEQASGFAMVVDRDCLGSSVDQDFLDSYWPNLVRRDGSGPDLGAALDDCVDEYDSGLPKEIPADFEPWSGEGTLAAVDPATRQGAYDNPPPMTIDPSKSYEAILTTDDGEIRVQLYADVAPVTVNNFVSLARDGYYDGTVFHRVLQGFMAQGGDPTGTGGGGPGYTFEDENAGLTAVDKRGLLAMANGGPDTNGSQFFITFDPAEHLNGLHTVFGEVVGGDDVLADIDLRDPDQPTSRGQTLLSVEIVES